jgi:hypothetical protein
MATDVPKDLKEKIRMIDKESRFLAGAPIGKPRSGVILVIALLMWGIALFELWYFRGDDYHGFVILVLALLMTSQYIYMRHLSQVYSSALEIIHYYREKERA